MFGNVRLFQLIKSTLSPAPAKILAQRLWLALTPDRIGLENQWKHPWMREKAKNQLNVTKIYLYIWHFWEKSMYMHLPYWHFIKIRSKCDKTHTASSLADTLRFLRFPDRRNTRKQDPFKSQFGPFRGWKFGVQRCRLRKCSSRALFGFQTTRN